MPTFIAPLGVPEPEGDAEAEDGDPEADEESVGEALLEPLLLNAACLKASKVFEGLGLRAKTIPLAQ